MVELQKNKIYFKYFTALNWSSSALFSWTSGSSNNFYDTTSSHTSVGATKKKKNNTYFQADIRVRGKYYLFHLTLFIMYHLFSKNNMDTLHCSSTATLYKIKK